MAEAAGETRDILWRDVLRKLIAGQAVEIPCDSDRSFTRRATQIVKRAKKSGLQIDILRAGQFLRVEPRLSASSNGQPPNAGGDPREARRRHRAQLRTTLRAERAAVAARAG
jgi:hypothetical protein